MQKKHLTLIIVLLTSGFGAYIYFNPPGETKINTISITDTITVNRIINDSNDICMNFETFSPSELSVTLVKDMITTYRNNQLVSIKTSTSRPMLDDAHSIWFDIDTLKKFIYHIQQGVKQNDPTGSHQLGLRIYFASYPDKGVWGTPGYEALSSFISDPEKSKYDKMHTLVMVPTILTGNVYSDFNPKDKASFGGYRNLWERNNGEAPPGYKAMVLSGSVNSANNNETIGVRNHGQLIPPGDPNGEAF